MAFPRFTLTDLGTLPGFLLSHATAINNLPDRTQVTGYALGDVPGSIDSSDQPAAAFLWEALDGQPGQFIDLHHDYSPPGISNSKALGLNSRSPSTVVGWLSLDGTTQPLDGILLPALTPVPTAWTVDDGASILVTFPTFPGASGAGKARSVNNANVIVGHAYNAQGLRRAFVKLGLREERPMFELQPRSGNQGESDAYFINDNGLVVGWTTAFEGNNKHACLWNLGNNYQNAANASNEVFTTIPLAEVSTAYSVNAGGYIAGLNGTLGMVIPPMPSGKQTLAISPRAWYRWGSHRRSLTPSMTRASL